MDQLDRQPPVPTPSTPLDGAPLVFFDLETTGLRVDRGATITEAAVVDSGGLRLHWQADDAGRTAAELLTHLADLFADVAVVGHNVTFDLQFLAQRAERLDTSAPATRYIDTLPLARKLVDPPGDSYTLSHLAEHFDLSPDGEFHTAPTDTRVVRDLFWHLVVHENLTTMGDAGLTRFDIQGT